MTPDHHQAARDAKAADLRTDAIEELENDDRLNAHEAGEHDETPDRECRSCEEALEAAFEEHAWMSRAVKTWTGGNPYAPTSQDEMARAWSQK